MEGFIPMNPKLNSKVKVLEILGIMINPQLYPKYTALSENMLPYCTFKGTMASWVGTLF